MKFTIFSVLVLFLFQCSAENYDRYIDFKAIVKVMNDEFNDTCTGTLIHPQWVLTSAVCAMKTFYQEMRIFFCGLEDYNSANFIENTYIHPEFSAENRENDIALIELEDPADYDTRYFKIPKINSSLIAKKARVFKCHYNKYVTTTVSMETYNSPDYQEHAYYDRVVIINNDLCEKYPVFLSPERLCTYKSVACEGDEGAPLIANDTNEVVGLVSVSAVQAAICDRENCMIPVTTYTATEPYRAWIQEVTGLNIL